MVSQKNRFIKFCIVGGTGTAVNLGVLFLLVEHAHLDENMAWLIAVMLSILNNFLWNSFYTYRDRKAKSGKETAERILSYYFMSLAVMVFNFVVFRFAMQAGLRYMTAAFVAIVLSSILNFVLANKLVWKEENYLKSEKDIA